MSIQEHLNKIRNAIYGREVRESIAKGIETAYDDASENGNANMEVKIARGTHPTLRDRLNEVDNKQQQTNAQLAQTATKEEVNSRFENIVSGSPKETFETLNELKTIYPNGTEGVMLVLEDGHWYFWNITTSNWTNGGVYQATQVVETINEYDLTGSESWGTVYTPWTIRVESRNLIPIKSRINIEIVAGVGQGYIYLLEKTDETTFVVKDSETFEGVYNNLTRIETDMYAEGNGREYVAVVHEHLRTIGLSHVDDADTQTVCHFVSDDGVVNIGDTLAMTATNGSKVQLRFNVILSNIHYLNELKTLNKDVELLSGRIVNNKKPKINNKTWNAMGDSVTQGLKANTNYAEIIASRNNMILRNYGISGSSITVSADGGSSGGSMVNRVQTMETPADYVTVFGGTNDFGYQRTLGTFDDRVDNTFYGALHLMIDYLYTTYSGSKIGFIIPTPRTEPDNPIKFKQYLDILREVLEYYSVPYLDLNKEVGFTPHNTNNMSLMIPDGLHPSDTGHEMIADKVETFLNGL